VVVQGEKQVVVARGDADEHHRFVADIVVPIELEPGPVVVLAHSEEAVSDKPIVGNGGDGAMTISAAPAPAGGRHEVEALYPAPEQPGGNLDDNSPTRGIVIAGLGVAAVLASLGAWAIRGGWR